MKRSLLFACCLVLTSMLYAQTQEETSESTIANQNANSVDDLAPYPFDDKKPEKKTFREKVRESIHGEQESPDSIANAEEPEVHIRFYEFKDITFEGDEIDFETENHKVGPIDEYELIEDDSAYVGDGYYKDVTFENEKKIEEQKDIKYDDEVYSPYKKRYRELSRNAEKSTVPEKKEDQTIKIKSTQNSTTKPIEIKGKDHYRKDYIYYYYNRKKKAGSDIASMTSYSQAIERCRQLFNEDKKAVRTIYETQLQEADGDFSEKINITENEEEKENLKGALAKTKIIIKRVYEEEDKNLQNAFDKAAEGLDKKFNSNKQYSRNYNGRGTKRGD